MRLFQGRTLVLLGAALACGCSLLAKKTPTPAADLKAEELSQRQKISEARYFILFFGSQDRLHRPEFTHTSAALIRVRSDIPGSAVPGRVDPALDVRMISWLPTSGTIDPRSRTVVPGRNYALHETLESAYKTEQSVAMWGPYEVWHGFAHRFTVQKEFLDSGAVGYQCIDSWGEAGRLGNGCDCIHAITDMDPIYPRWGYPLIYFGKPGTAHVVRRFMHSPIWIHPRETHDWLLPRLGLDAYPLQKRHYIGKAVEHPPNSTRDLESKVGPLDPVPEPKVPVPMTDPVKPPVPPVKER